MPPFPRKTLAALAAIVLLGTAYSVLHDTYLDTSNPLLSHLPHPLHSTHYFASKRNPLNVWFTKRLWGWTTLAFIALFFTSPPSARLNQRVYKFLATTAVWLLFTSWFFGPPLMERLTAFTGGECVAYLPSGAVINVPAEYCYSRSSISPITHPGLFSAMLALPEDGWKQIPRLRRGHDVSGHLFLLTMSVLFLVEQLQHSFYHSTAMWPSHHKWAVAGNILVIAAGFLATYTTSVYFHTPVEKLTGFALGIAGYAVTRLFEPQPIAAVRS